MIQFIKQFKFMLVLCLTLLLTNFLSTPVEAAPPDYSGGVANEYTYEEAFFLDSYPITFSGKPTITERKTKDKITKTYRFNLTSKSGDKLTRSIVYETTLENRADKGQTTSQTTIKSYSEKITTASKAVFTLDDFQFSQAAVNDNRPASDFYSGDLVGRKIYKVTRPGAPKDYTELITVHMTGRNMGYENFWGATETQIIDYEIITNSGTTFVTSKVSDSKTKTLKYQPHDPSISSFPGGHIVVSNSDMVGKYTYAYPYYSRAGVIELSQKNATSIERLIVPKFRDLNKHWAKDAIEKLYSIGVFDETSQFFSPNTPMNRYQYTIGVLKAVDMRVYDTKSKVNSTKSIFKDIDRRDKGYSYIESAVNQGIIHGITADTFKPDDPITRAQAVAVLVRALGMEGRAPSPGYKTKFSDDRLIPNWAKDSAYVAYELGLVQGDAHKRFKPQQQLTRAEASAMIQRFLEFLEHDLQENYREDILQMN
ncbi:S-layer homology domain-containing protein [Sporosarcina sp. ITBMC105]